MYRTLSWSLRLGLGLCVLAPFTLVQTTAFQVSTPGRFGALAYTAPAGWTTRPSADRVVFTPADLPAPERLTVQIMPSLNAAVSIEQALERSFAEATEMYKGASMFEGAGQRYGSGPARVSFNGWTYIRGRGGVRLQDGTRFGAEYGLEVFVVKVNARFERVAILESRPSCGTISQTYYPSDRRSYRKAIETLLFSLQFTDLPATALKPGSAVGPGIVGAWSGISQSTGAATGLRLDAFSAVFFDNGQVYYAQKFPTEGLDGLQSRLMAELLPRNWGTYTFSAGTGSIKMPFGEFPLRMTGGELFITRNKTDWRFGRLTSVDGAAFDDSIR